MASPITIDRIDHMVLTVADIDATCEFYGRVLGMEEVVFAGGRVALGFGRQKINLHPAGNEYDPRAKHPVPGSGDFIRQVQVVTGAAPLAAAGGQVKPDQVSGFLRDQVNILPTGSPIATGILGTAVTTGISYLAAVATQLADSWAITNAAVTLGSPTLP